MALKKKIIIILGPPGSGKGTQAKLLCQKYHLFYFGTGDLLREEVKKGTKIGKKFQAVWDRGEGELVPDELIDEFVFRKLAEVDQEKGIVFDGYPRTIKQAENLEVLLKGSLENCLSLNIEVPAEALIQRMSTRKVCDNCGKIFYETKKRGLKVCDQCRGNLIQRQEDAPEIIKKRLAVYEAESQKLIDYYKMHDILVNIDGRPSIKQVAAEIEAVLERA